MEGPIQYSFRSGPPSNKFRSLIDCSGSGHECHTKLFIKQADSKYELSTVGAPVDVAHNVCRTFFPLFDE